MSLSNFLFLHMAAPAVSYVSAGVTIPRDRKVIRWLMGGRAIPVAKDSGH